MPRPHIEFIQAQVLPWASLGDKSVRPGAREKVLSRDPKSGASSTIIHYPPAWELTVLQSLGCDEELFVLDGSLNIGGRQYLKGDYAYLPAGWSRTGMSSPAGCVILTFFEGYPETISAAEYFDSTDLVEYLPSSRLPWISVSEPRVARTGVGRKVLRPDSAAGERSWIMKIEAPAAEPFEVNGVERHPCVEEMFLLEGGFAMTSGLMQAGAYFWRPPGIAHGPMGTKTGFLALFRCKEGAFSTDWSKPEVPVPWDTPYQPVLPDELLKFSRCEFSSDTAW